MKLYLVRHGEAKPAEIDPSRGLTAKGIQDVTKVAEFLSNARLAVNEIFHSGKTRAQQTASILADHITVRRGVFDSDGLSPNDDPSIWTARLSRITEDTMLVGHLPHLAKLTARLLSDDPKSPSITFHSAGVLCIDRSQEGWSVEWMIVPDIIK
jgi:phosphohistidine phosphatase